MARFLDMLNTPSVVLVVLAVVGAVNSYLYLRLPPSSVAVPMVPTSAPELPDAG